MGIDKSGELWRADAASDIDAFLTSFRAGGYAVQRSVHARCSRCGGDVFRVRVDDLNGYADRRCEVCGDRSMMLDSADVADEALPEECACPCGNETFEVAVGFAQFDDGGVRWVSLGMRCRRDGTLGVYADWKIDYEPSAGLFDSV